ncbi:MAG: tyrosine-type recombinase/integrase [Acidithiobacillus sp.]|nr:tyrosine-type recombinase/integrase [Acidithiobacillus sp.]
MNLESLDHGDILRILGDLSEESIKVYLWHISTFNTWISENALSWNDVTRSVVNAYCDKMKKDRNWSISTTITALSALTRFFDGLVEYGVVEDNPSRGAVGDRRVRRSSARIQKRLPVVLFEDEEQRFLEITQVLGLDSPLSFQALRARQIARLLYFTGLREHEAIQLRVADLHLDSDMPVIRVIGKGDREREVPLGPIIQQELLLFLEARETFLRVQKRCTGSQALVFCDAMGGPLSRSGVYYIVSMIFASLGLVKRNKGPHVLRHTFATRQLRAGIPVAVVKTWLGHATLAVTLSVYEHVAEASGKARPV